jgi:hypothetical protein
MTEGIDANFLTELQSGKVFESQVLEFKEMIDFGDGKAGWLDDVVGFLNAGPGRMLIGVAENKRGGFHKFKPVGENVDEFARRVLSVIQDNIEPRPLNVEVKPVSVPGGHILDIDIGANFLKPYANRLSGRHCRRTSAKNVNLTAGEINSLFTPLATMSREVLSLMETENRAVEARHILEDCGSTFHLAILPQMHYEPEPTFFDPVGTIAHKMVHFHESRRSGHFVYCEGGFELVDTGWSELAASRLFISDDWRIHLYVAHPLSQRPSGEVTLLEFRDSLTRYLGNLQALLDECGCRAPFCLYGGVANIKRNAKIAWAFRAVDKAFVPRPLLKERVDDPDFIKLLFDKVCDASAYGRQCDSSDN